MNEIFSQFWDTLPRITGQIVGVEIYVKQATIAETARRAGRDLYFDRRLPLQGHAIAVHGRGRGYARSPCHSGQGV